MASLIKASFGTFSKVFFFFMKQTTLFWKKYLRVDSYVNGCDGCQNS